MKLNRTLVLCLSIALAVTLATTGTIAYLSDTDSDVNVMTLGNVQVEQFEMERVFDENGKVNGMQPFTQGQPLYPVYAEPGVDPWQPTYNQDITYGEWIEGAQGWNGLWANMTGEMDKFVFVKNTGTSDLYYRTWFAFEADTTNTVNKNGQPLIHYNFNGNERFVWDDTVGNVTIDGVPYRLVVATYQEKLTPGEISRPSLLQVAMDQMATNEYLAQYGNTYDILVLTQAVQTQNMPNAVAALNAAFGEVSAENHPWLTNAPILVYTVEELQKALDEAADGATIILNADITGDVTVTQKPGVKITIDGHGRTFDGVITVDGKSGTYKTAGLTIQDVNFKADSISADAIIRLGDGTNATRYTCNVTVSGCTFDVPGAVGVKSYTGGDMNLTITDCSASAAMHSLVQAKGIDGILVEKCTVNSKNGMNFNNSDNVIVDDCKVDTLGYCVRFGESSGGVGAAETYLIKDSYLTSTGEEGDAVIVLRGTADNATLTIENTTITGTPDIANTATGATVVR